MQNRESLAEKVNQLISKYQEVCAQNEALRNELVSVKAQNEALNSQLSKLEDDLLQRSIKEDDIFKQIESVLNK